MLKVTPVVEIALNRVPADVHSGVIEIIRQRKSTPAQKRALLLKKALVRNTADELEILSEVGTCSAFSCFS
jgi:translation initiation factor 2-alpha kinase 4